MTTLTHMSALNSSMFAPAPRVSFSRYAMLRASLPQLTDKTSLLDDVAGIAGRFVLAAVPFTALGWLFIAR